MSALAEAESTPASAHAPARSLRVFVCHPSSLLTDHQPHGDGLLAHRTILELARRGHRLEVTTGSMDCETPFPPNVRVHVIEPTSKIEWINRFAYALKMRRVFKRLHEAEPFDIVHQLNPVATGLSMGLAGCGVPIVLGPYVGYWPVRDTFSKRVASAVITAASWAQQQLASAVILATPEASYRVLARRRVRDRTYVIPYGIDVDSFPMQPAKSDGRTVLFFAGTIWRKGIFTLLDAIALLRERMPDVELLVAGKGWDFEKVVDKIASDELGANVKILGAVPRSGIPELMARANVFCLPSFGEPYGMTAIEAMACGRAVVATDAGGLATLIAPDTGVLVPPGDAAALAAALERILRDPELAARMGERGRRRAEERYAWPAVIAALEAAYYATMRT